MNSRDIIRALEADGWRRVAQRAATFNSSIRQSRAASRSRTIAGHSGRDAAEHRASSRSEAKTTIVSQYIALIHKETDSDYGVSFPDFPGVITASVTLDEARAMAEEALGFHLDGLIEDGETIPEPSSLDHVMADPNNRDGVAILVPVRTPPARVVRVNVTLPEDVLAKIDRYAHEHGFTRSGFLAQAAKRALERDAD